MYNDFHLYFKNENHFLLKLDTIQNPIFYNRNLLFSSKFQSNILRVLELNRIQAVLNQQSFQLFINPSAKHEYCLSSMF